MKNISLFKISAMVITVALASNFVNAQDKVTHAVKTVQPATTQLVKKLNFPTLIEKLDTDKDGALSQAEVTTSHSELLQQIFTKVDTNNDKAFTNW